MPASPQYGVSYRCLLRQNQVLLTALEELQSRCATLKKENSLLHKSCFPETQEKVRHLKRKNAELAVIAKRLEERARKLQEANLKVVNTPVAVKGSCAGLCKKALARQRAMDLREQASVLLAKDKQINALHQECQDLQAKIMSGKEASSPCLPLLDFRHLLQESQKEVLRLQRQIALKNFKASLGSHSQGSGDTSLASVMGMGSPAPALPNGFSPSRVSRQRNVLSSAVEAVKKPPESGSSSPSLGGEVVQPSRPIRLRRPTQRGALRGAEIGSSRIGAFAAAPSPDQSFRLEKRQGNPIFFMQKGLQQRGPRAHPLAQVNDGYETLPVKKGVATAPETKRQIQQLESELRRKRKQCENLEHEVRKKHKRCAELEIQLQEVQSNNVRLCEENTLLHGQLEWTEKVESENADLKLQVAVVTEERDSALQKTQELQNRLESLGQALKHMRDVAERRQQLEQEHERALQALQKKQEEVRQLQQAQAEARKEHEGAVQLLENSLDCMQARVRELEDQCHSHTEQFNFLSQELKQFRLQTEKIGLPPSSQVTSEVTFTTCQTSLQLLEGLKEKDPEIATISPRCSQKAQDGGLEGSPRLADPVVPTVVRSPDANTPPLASKKMVRKLESQSSSSRSESMQNSPKSCPTPEVDTASEMEELEIDMISLIPEPENQGPVKLRVFLARYSYNPFAGPNENPEAELPLTAGEYIYVYGEMDEDGFFEGELMDGRRGLVPSNFVERVSDEDLVTFLPQELHDLSRSSPLERSSLSTTLSSAERSDCSTEELSASTAPSRLEEDEGAIPTERASLVVPYPRKVNLIKQFGSSLLVGWEPPLPTPGSSEIQSYNLYVDSELRQTVKAGSQTKAVVERLDLKSRTYRLSVQSVSEAGSSDRLRCTFLAGGGFAVAPTQLRVRSIAATSAQISWVPSNSNFPHTVYLNGKEHEATKAGVYWYTFRNLNPSSSYVATVEVQPQQQVLGEPAPEKQDQPLSAEIQFTTASAGSPDAPLDVRVEAGPSPGILVISWLPVTIDAEGSSNGVRVTGYAVYADGQKVMEVTSPTAGSVLAEISQLQILQVCQEVSVRTVSLYGESVDSVPAQIPLALLGDAGCSSPLEFGRPAVQLPGMEGQNVLAAQTSQVCGTEDTPAATASDSFAKSTSQPSTSRKKSGSALLVETSSLGSTSPTGAALTPPEMGPLPRGEGNAFVPVTEDNPAMLRKAAQKESEEGDQPLLVSRAQEAASRGEACSADLGAKEPPPEKGAESDQSCLGMKLLPPSRSSLQCEDRSGDSGQSERRAPESAAGSSGRLKMLKDDSLLAPRVRREGEKRSDAGNRPVTLLTDHSRGSDLSDIMEEEEEEEEEEANQQSGKAGESKWAPSECPGRENGEKSYICSKCKLVALLEKKLDLGDTDSDEEILERILEMPLQKNCSKALFSIPEVTEEEEEEEDWDRGLSRPVSPPLARKSSGDFRDRSPYKRTEAPPLPVDAPPKRNQVPSEEEVLPDVPGKFRKEGVSEVPTYPGGWEWDCPEIAVERKSSQWGRPSRCREKGLSPSQGNRKRKVDIQERSARSMLSNSHQGGGGGLYRARSLKENLDVITSLGVEDESELCSWARQRPRQRRTVPLKAAGEEDGPGGLSRCLSPESLEINVEYDSDEDMTITSTPASQLSLDGRPDGSPTDCEEGWSDSSSRSGSVQSSGPRELKRCSSWEEESGEWSTSPSRSPGRLCWRRRVFEGASEERSRSLERSPSLWRGGLERPWKDVLPPSHPRVYLVVMDQGLILPRDLFQVSGNGNLELLNSASWQVPTRRGRRPRRRCQDVAEPPDTNSDSWRSPSPEPMDSGGSARLFVALFDYDPPSMSPNPDAAEEELPFQEGQILKVYGHKDADGFYRGKCGGRTGYVPCNMVSEVQVDSEATRKQLLEEGRIPTDMLVESLDNGVFSPPPRRLTVRPPKPRRSKKVEQEKQEEKNPCFDAHEGQDLSSEDDAPRTMVAIFDYNPKESSPNLDTEAELRFCAGDIVTVLSSMDDDGFYYGEVNGKKGLAPSNFLEAMSLDGELPGEPSLGRQVRGVPCWIGA
ncbi:peripheral-type benzodiazepine receptor-associated protein 1 [Zootoca vivipara]|uniref:peripheral-type benzodiazepine receptor-associated protein 1 n=1 Tax=Zootoca vivipara TaxID=8524 RepID=UPI00293B8FB2|nr:peripheral-type benzodiazepine receptor-associated protein 1 [Zootoca vivipara]